MRPFEISYHLYADECDLFVFGDSLTSDRDDLFCRLIHPENVRFCAEREDDWPVSI